MDRTTPNPIEPPSPAAMERHRYQALVEATGAFVWKADAGANVIQIISSHKEREFGTEPTPRDRWDALIHPDDRPAVRAAWKKALANPHSFQLTARMHHRDGQLRTLQIRVVPVRDDLGQLHEWIGVTEDITARIRAEQELHAKEARLRMILNAEPECVKCLNREYLLLEINPAGLSMIQAESESEVLGQSILQLVDEPYREAFRELTDRVFQGEEGTLEFSITGLKGQPRWLETHAAPLRSPSGEIDALIGITRDISDRKAAEAAWHLSESRYRTLFERAPDGILIADAESRYLDANERICRMLGYRRDELIGLNAGDIVDETEQDHIASALAVIRNRNDYRREWRFRRKDGSTFPVDVMASTLPDGKLIGIIRDISDQKRADEQLRASEQLYRMMFESNPQPLWVYDLETYRFLEVNEATVAKYGWSRDEFLRMSIFEIRQPEDRNRLVESIRGATNPLEYSGVWRHVLRDGRMIDVEITSHVLTFQGRPARLVQAHDITERKKLVDALRDNEARLIEILRRCPIGMAITRVETREFVSVNDAFSAVSGWTNEEIVGKTTSDLNLVDPVAVVPIRKLLAEQGFVQNAELRMRTRSGEWRDCLFSVQQFELAGEKYAITSSVDITDRKRAEDHVSQLNRTYAVLSDINQLIVRERDPKALLPRACHIAVAKGEFLFAWIGRYDSETGMLKLVAQSGASEVTVALVQAILNDPVRGCEMTRTALQQRRHDTCNNIATDPRAEPWRAAALERGYRSMISLPLMVDHQCWGTFNLYASVPDFFDEDELRLLDELATDIAFALEISRRGAEQAEAEHRLRLLDRAIQTVRQGVVISDATHADAPIVTVSSGFERITGYTASEILGKNCRFLQGQKTSPEAVTRVRQALRDGRSITLDILNYRKDGTPFWNELSLAPIRDDGGRVTHIVGVQNDVTERKSLEDQLRQAQKMEAIGRLAGGVAHDFNNLLTVINGYSELLLDQVETESPTAGLLREIHRAGERAGNLTRQLLAFSRQQVLDPKVVNLNVIVAETQRMLVRLIGEDVQLSTRLSPTLGLIRVDPGQVEQILLNLCVNARDAMPAGGTITIETRNVLVGPDDCRDIPEAAPGSYVAMEVTDTGTGIERSIMPRIFEPFFTTKEAGKGTGLGLATVHGIVRQSGGFISVVSESGQGTTFRIYFPEVDVPLLDAMVSTASTVMPPGRETILYVEDEDAVRSLGRHVLESCGYHVLEASQGREAIQRAESFNGPIHLLMTDVIMPVLGGRELSELILQSRPDCKILFLSGYTDDAIVRHGVFDAEYSFLNKPFTPARLAQKVRNVLDGKG